MQQVQAESQMAERSYTSKEFNALRVISVTVARTINKVSDE